MSTHRRSKALQLGYLVILLVSTAVQEIFDQLCILGIISQSQNYAVVALMAWKNYGGPRMRWIAKLDSVPIVYIDKDLVGGFLPNADLTFINNLYPIRSEVEKKVSTLHGTQGAYSGTLGGLPIWHVLSGGLVFLLRLE